MLAQLVNIGRVQILNQYSLALTWLSATTCWTISCCLPYRAVLLQTADPKQPPVVFEELGERKRRRTNSGNAERDAAPAEPPKAAKPSAAATGKPATGALAAVPLANGRALPAAAKDTESEDEGEKEAEERLFCLCQQPYIPEQAMVSCDACGEWWHLRCVGISQSHARSAKVYHCPFCRSLRVRLYRWVQGCAAHSDWGSHKSDGHRSDST